jgi:hypothetical protein
VTLVWRVRPSREFAPAGDLLSCVDKKVGKETTPEKPPTRFAGGCSQCSKTEAPRETPSATLRSDSHAESVIEACCARGLGLLRLRRFQRGAPKQPNSRAANSQQPNAATERCRLFLHPPFEPAEERRTLRPCAQRTSWTDSAQLSDRSVAEGVLRAASRSDVLSPDTRQSLRTALCLTKAMAHAGAMARREPRCEAKGRAVRGRLFAYFLVAQKTAGFGEAKVGRPRGRIPRMGLATTPAP